MAASPNTKAPAEPEQTKVYCRTRPFIDNEGKTPPEGMTVARPVLDVDKAKPDTLKLLDSSSKFKTKKEVAFERLFWCAADGIEESVPNAKQEDLYKAIGPQTAKHICEGFNTTLCVCGHGKTGKTTTLFGTMKSDGDERGIFPRFAFEIFDMLAGTKPDHSEMLVEMQMLEVEDEAKSAIVDLLAKKATGKHQEVEALKLRDEAEGVFVQNALWMKVTNCDEMINFAKTGLRARKKNHASAHVVISIKYTETLSFKDPADPKKTVTKVGKAFSTFAMVSGKPTTLSRCIENAAARDSGENPNAKVALRESPLTRLLTDFLGGHAGDGNCHANIIVCVSPFFKHVKETVTALDMAARCSKINHLPSISYDSSTTAFRKLHDEVQSLNKEMSAATSAQQTVQDELDRRQAALDDTAFRHRDHSNANELAASQLDTETMVQKVRMQRRDSARTRSTGAEGELEGELQECDDRVDELDGDAASMTAATAALAAKLVADEENEVTERDATAGLEEEVDRNETRYTFVADIALGIGARKVKIVDAHKKDMTDKFLLTKAHKQEKRDLDAKIEEMAPGLRIVKIAADGVNAQKKAHQDQVDRKKALADEKAALEKELETLEQQLKEKQDELAKAEAGCCVVM
jgi:hypothetical protein